MAKFELEIRIFDREGKQVFSDSVAGGSNSRPSMLAEADLKKSIKKLKSLVDKFRKGERHEPPKPTQKIEIEEFKKIDVISINEELIKKILEKVIAELSPKHQNPMSSKLYIKNIGSLKKTKMEVIYENKKTKGA